MEKNLYTISDLSQLTGISTRTIRFYDQKKLLKPTAYTEGGYRLYNQQSLQTLQRILVFKHLGFSLSDIEVMLQNKSTIENYLKKQKSIFEKQLNEINHKLFMMDMIMNAKSEDKWEPLVNICYDISHEDVIKQQYTSPSLLQKRINIHSYSTSPIEWFDFYISHMKIKENSRILEIGCGTGSLWEKLIYHLPNNLEITLTDYSENMLLRCKAVFERNKDIIKNKNINVSFQLMDANNLELEENKYDLIIANHVLYHVSNRKHCIKTIANCLKPNGFLYASTTGQNHMRDLFILLNEFDEHIENPHNPMVSGFSLENATEQLKPYFSKIQRIDHKNDLKVTDIQPIIDYVASLPGNSPYVVSQKMDAFHTFLENKLSKENYIYIRKSTGFFICEK